MLPPPSVKPVDWRGKPLELFARWPAEQPIAILHSAGRHPRWARWTIITQPESWLGLHGTPRGGENTGDGRRDAGAVDDPLRALDAAWAGIHETARGPLETGVPFTGGWLGFLSYDLGQTIEPAARCPTANQGARPRGPWPLIELAWCPQALIYDNSSRRWFAVGDRAVQWLRDASVADPPAAPSFTVGPPSSSLPPDAYLHTVRRAIEYIASGDIFQANITQRLTYDFAGSTRRLARQALTRSPAWYGAYLELPDGRCIVSMSPELFLDVRWEGESGRRRVTTRPIKGTRPASADPRELRDSEKDAAELHMIIDLMRNDLGRVCAYRSVRVPTARVIETHGTVHHGVGEVTGVLRDRVTLGELLAATFPGGSVTGAPKIRAMQIIDELEPVHRGPYCGSVGFISRSGEACLNIAIRTIQLAGQRPAGRFDRLEGRLEYGVGGGIVADSEPLAEYRESLDKAAALRLALGAPSPRATESPTRV